MSKMRIEPSRHDRLVAILTAFSPLDSSHTLSSLASATGLPLSTVHRLTAHMCRVGLLQRDFGKRYYIGPSVESLTGLADRRFDLHNVAMPYMQDLFAASGENVQLTVLSGNRAVCIEKLRGHRSVATTTRQGTPRLLHATSSGKLFLAFSGSRLFEEVVAEGLHRCTPRTITLPRLLDETVLRARETQLAYAAEETAVGISAIAAPIFAPRGEIAATISVVARSSTDVRALGKTITDVAQAVSRRIQASHGIAHRRASPAVRTSIRHRP